MLLVNINKSEQRILLNSDNQWFSCILEVMHKLDFINVLNRCKYNSIALKSM